MSPIHAAAFAEGRIESAIDSFIAEAQFHAKDRTPQGRQDALDAHRVRLDGQFLGRIATERKIRVDGLRMDAIDQGQSLGLPREFQFMYNRELEEVRQPLNGMKQFRRDPSVPVGAKEYRIVRGYLHGEAKVHSGSNADIPRVGASRKESIRPVKYLVSSYGANVLELLATNFAGLGEMERKRRAAQLAIEQLRNELIFNGSEEHDIWGVLTHPYLPKLEAQVALTGTIDPDAVLAELHRIASYAVETSDGAFTPNRMLTTKQVRNKLAQTRMSSNTDTTILEQFLKNSETIKAIETAAELRGAGPDGTDGMLVYNDDVDSCSIVAPNDYAELPMQAFQFENVVYCWAAFGGARMDNVGSNLLAYWEV